MTANWSRFSALVSAFAPASISTFGPDLPGRTTAIPGRTTRLMRPIVSSDDASIAPVEPADSAAPARPSLTSRQAVTRDESGFERTACTGSS